MPKIIHNGKTYAGLPDIDYDCEISNVTLYAANWSSGVYTISDPRIDSTTIQEYIPGLGITDSQLEALQAANICDFGQDNGHAYLKAYGDTPSIDIPIRVIFNPGVKTKEVSNLTPYKNVTETIASGFTCPSKGVISVKLYNASNFFLRINDLILINALITGASDFYASFPVYEGDVITYQNMPATYSRINYFYGN